MVEFPGGKEAAKGVDRQELVTQMEPLAIAGDSRHRAGLNDLALDLASKAAGFRRSLPPALLEPLATLVRAMNCYYSNLIEGRDTHPVDIERALNGDYSGDPAKRDLQLEARAHMEVQRWIDEGGLAGRAVSADGLIEIHLRFCQLLPAELLRVRDPDSGEISDVIPGALRDRDVKVGNHIPVSPGAVPRFLERYERFYGHLGLTDTVVAAAAAHHRLLWIHPFLDGNGRVARLASHALLAKTLDSGAIWSVARGLARNAVRYKSLLANCDQTRRNDLDGRGNLSEEALAEFTRFFLTTCIDQIEFMESLMQPGLLRTRISLWAAEEIRLGKLPPKSIAVLDAVVYRGEVNRGDVSAIISSSDRNARRAVSALIGAGVLTSASPRSPLKLAFPANLASRWMPGLFPEKVD